TYILYHFFLLKSIKILFARRNDDFTLLYQLSYSRKSEREEGLEPSTYGTPSTIKIAVTA
ncbi:MAG: hypothetical protein UH211_08890, partial [Agathobacter sp.]|nr:hypothetical protein [Agathobacter sp.]